MVTKLKIAMLMATMAVAGWTPLKELRGTIVKLVHAAVISSVVEAQRDAALDQSSYRKADLISPRRQPEKARRLAAVRPRVIEKRLETRFIAIRVDAPVDAPRPCGSGHVEPVLNERLGFLIGS